ncbi:uncharacterized protein FIBRA_08549 [Fibroporia radiculosa]|uniref:Protein kinase domain-containing protein n=1 Tax=Fibroporia radiculosa TaxID=599839 RepID=J4GHP1_9APHY|nr:uncharacterized protein FIBRA_08549 [Fibroporia radiculosa]CCM06298.1 predicted protein [Fibroporia radiculosa]
MLGRFPDPWWNLWRERQVWFDETGVPKPEADQRREGVLLPAVKSSLRHRLRAIGEQDDSGADGGRMFEKSGLRLQDAEVELFADLLEKMMKYRPEDRISIHEVVQHPQPLTENLKYVLLLANIVADSRYNLMENFVDKMAGVSRTTSPLPARNATFELVVYASTLSVLAGSQSYGGKVPMSS